MIVNAYCRTDGGWGGWLFDDLRRSLGKVFTLPGVAVVESDRPMPDADAWIAVRTDEALSSPDPARTVVQVHDFREHRSVIEQKERFGAFSLVHHLQETMWGRSALVRPIGARRLFTLRDSMPERFTVGWVGRDVVWQGRHIKRPELFVEAVEIARGIMEIEAAMYGPGLEHYAEKIGARHVTGDRAESLRDFYHSIDVLVVTCEPEPGPLTVFEALACGVPVCGVPAGGPETTGALDWTIYSSERQEPANINEAEEWREEAFEEREKIRASVRYRQDQWAEANVRLAAGL